LQATENAAGLFVFSCWNCLGFLQVVNFTLFCKLLQFFVISRLMSNYCFKIIHIFLQ